MSEVAQDQYIDDYLAHEGIRLEPTKIKYNQGLRQTMKIILNSLWGKFGQRGNMTQSKICMEANDFYSLVLNDRFEIHDMFQCPSNPQVMELLYTEKENTAQEPQSTNVYLACFTTCHARLQLFATLKTLGRAVLYYDTDSVIYVRPKDTLAPVQTGKYLGDLTNELCNDGSRWITEFVSTGPKSYSYQDNEGRIVCKFKGVTKTLHNLSIVNLKSMVECIQEGTVQVGAKNLIFQLDRHGHIQTKYQMKVFRMVYDKRWIGSDYVTFPWGYCR